MKALSFNFENPSEKDKAVKDVLKRFRMAGIQVITSSVDQTPSKRAGVSYRNLNLTFADGQTVAMAFKSTGDVFEVRANGKAIPLKNQDDYVGAIEEIVARLDAGRAAFQKALARVRAPLPPSIRTSRASLLKQKREKRDALKQAIQTVRDELAVLREGPAASP